MSEEEARAEEERNNQTIPKEMIEEIKNRIATTKADEVKFLHCFNVKSIEEMTVADGEQAIEMLKLKEAKLAECKNR